MLIKETLYALGDVTIIPEVTSKIRHRSECNVFYENADRDKCLPIFTAPMDMVVNKDNYSIFAKNHIIPILPRTESLSDRMEYATSNKWAAFGLDEFDKYFCNEQECKNLLNKKVRVLIDIANGHIEAMQQSIRTAKSMSGKIGYCIEIMAGNVAHPEAYENLANAGADYVRCSIGSGNLCITSSNTSVHMPMASLLDECFKRKEMGHLKCAIIADGGINSYSNAIKALALGADYVMMGTTLAKSFESAGEFISGNILERDIIDGFNINELNHKRFNSDLSEREKKEYISKFKPLKKVIYGMSTKKAQTKIAMANGSTKGNVKLKTSEGVEKEIIVEYTIHQWVNNFIDYLRSAMSYCNFDDIIDFVGGPNVYLLSESAKNSINK